jgi:DNA-binding MarR family transcriptional regulator
VCSMSGNQVQVEINKIGRECLCLQSRMTTRAITRRYNTVLAPIGLEVTEFSLLAALHVGRHSSITELADRLAFERTTLVRNLKHMAERSLIESATQKGRAVKYILTKKGLSLLTQALPLWAAAQTSVHEQMAPGTASKVLASLKTLRRATRQDR